MRHTQPNRAGAVLLLLAVLVVLAAALVVAGCGDKYVGTWKVTSYNGLSFSGMAEQTMTIKKDGSKYVQTFSGQDTKIEYTNDGSSLNAGPNVTITVDGDTLTWRVVGTGADAGRTNVTKAVRQ